MGTLLGEPPSRRGADAAAAADDDGDVARQQLGRPLLGDLLLDLPPLQRPVLELEDVLLRDELEAVHRLRVGDALQRGAVAEVGGDRVALVAEGGDEAQCGGEDDLGPVVERALARLGVAAVVVLVFDPRLLELLPNAGGDLVGRGEDPSLDRNADEERPPGMRCPARSAAAPREGGAPASPSRGAASSGIRSVVQSSEHIVRVVVVEDDPIRLAQRTSNDRQHQLGQALARSLGQADGWTGRTADRTDERSRRLAARYSSMRPVTSTSRA